MCPAHGIEEEAHGVGQCVLWLQYCAGGSVAPAVSISFGLICCGFALRKQLCIVWEPHTSNFTRLQIN